MRPGGRRSLWQLVLVACAVACVLVIVLFHSRRGSPVGDPRALPVWPAAGPWQDPAGLAAAPPSKPAAPAAAASTSDRIKADLLARINSNLTRPARRPDPPPSRRAGAFCGSCGEKWCTAAARPDGGGGALVGVGGFESWCVAELDAALDRAVFTAYPGVTTLDPPAIDCSDARILSVYKLPRTGLGHFHALYNYFLHLAVASGWSFVHTSPLLALGQSGAFDADQLLFHKAFAVGGGPKLCPRTKKTQFMLQSASQKDRRWMSLNDERVSAAKAAFNLVLNVGLARGTVNGNYNLTGPIYRARLRRVAGAGRVPEGVATALSALLLYDPAAAAAAAGPRGAARCAASGAVFRVGVHVRRGDILYQVKYHDRAQSVYYFEGLLDRVLALLPACLLPHTVVSVFSAGADASEMEILVAAAVARGAGFVRAFQPPEQPPDRQSVPTLYALAAQDVIIGSKSGFTHLAAVYAPRAVTLAVPFTHPYEAVARFVAVSDEGDGGPRFDEEQFQDFLFARLAERCNRCGRDWA